MTSRLTDLNYLVWDYNMPREYMKRFRKGLDEIPPLIISVAITGAAQGAEANPALPETPQAQAQSTYEAWTAGASIVHVHARRAENLGMMAHDTARYHEVNSLIRERCPDIIINNTTSGDLIDNPQGHEICERGSLYANPEMVALDMGPNAFRVLLKERRPPLSGRDEDVRFDGISVHPYHETEWLAREMKRLGIKPEFEVFSSGQFHQVDMILDLSLDDTPHWVQFVMGGAGGSSNYATPHELLHMAHELPPKAMFSVIGIGPFQLPLHAMAIVMGGHVRVGLEDNVYFRRGELATSNAQFVERIVRLAEELGRQVATPMEARAMLGLSSTPSEYSSATAAVETRATEAAG